MCDRKCVCHLEHIPVREKVISGSPINFYSNSQKKVTLSVGIKPSRGRRADGEGDMGGRGLRQGVRD